MGGEVDRSPQAHIVSQVKRKRTAETLSESPYLTAFIKPILNSSKETIGKVCLVPWLALIP